MNSASSPGSLLLGLSHDQGSRIPGLLCCGKGRANPSRRHGNPNPAGNQKLDPFQNVHDRTALRLQHFLRQFCVSAHTFCHRPFLAEVAAFQHSALRLAEQGERNWLSHMFIPLLPQEDSEFLPFHYSQKSSLYSSTVIHFLIEV